MATDNSSAISVTATDVPAEFTVDPAGNVTPTRYTSTVDVTQHTTEKHNGHRVDFNSTTDTDRVLSGEYDDRFRKIANGAVVEVLKDREAAENLRANRRNRNRILILIVVLIMELTVPTLYGMHLLPALFLKYEVLAITAPDALLTVYAYVRKY
jgi:hypothetical protein